MSKDFLKLLLTFSSGVAGNLFAAYIQQDAWENLFTPDRLLATLVGAGVILLALTLLESERGLAWNWPWHRFWYLRGLAANDRIRQWETDFARLNVAQGKRPIATTELVANGQRHDMVTLLYNAFQKKDSDMRRVLILGEPGAGKTTGLERLTLEFARQKKWRLGAGQPIPVLIRLGNYHDGDFVAFIQKEMSGAVSGQSGSVLSGGLETLLSRGRVILLCDALDEALGRQRELVLAQLDSFLRNQRYSRTRVVITARTREDPGGRLPDLPVYTIQDLQDDAVRAFIAVYRQPDADETEIHERLNRAGLLDAGGLGRNPFWLRIVIQSGVFQGEKGKILDEAVTRLLEREWSKPESLRAGWQRVATLTKDEQLSESRKALAWLAYQMSAADLVSVNQTQGQEWVQAGLKRHSSPEQLRATHVIGLGRDAQLLTYLSDNLRFRHRLLQEAMTAWLLAQDSVLQNEAIVQYADETGWWETLLMLGHLTTEPEALVNAVLVENSSEQRLFLAVGLLQSITQPDAALRQRVMNALHQSLGAGITDGHRTAVMALAKIMRDDVSALLTDLFLTDNEPVQNGVALLLAELGDDAVQSALSKFTSGGVTDRYKAATVALARINKDGVVALLSALFFESDASLQPDILTLLIAVGDNDGNIAAVLFPEARSIQERAEIGRVLARLGDPRPGVGVIAAVGLPDLVWSAEIPAGRYNIGDELRPVSIDSPYCIACYPITNAQFQCFVEAVDRDHEAWWTGMPEDRRGFSESRWSYANHPRETVSWYQAMAFCRWLTHKLHEGVLPAGPLTGDVQEYVITLPHEYEWVVAARWPNEKAQEHVYPWGSDFDADKANTSEGSVGQTTAVGIYPSGRNKTLELYDLSGNVWEWCRNKRDAPEVDEVDSSNDERVLRGGSWRNLQYRARAAYRNLNPPDYRGDGIGFRVVVRRPPSHHDLWPLFLAGER